MAVYRANDDVRIEERPLPSPSAGEALLRIRASGVCGSDVMEWYRKPKAPTVLGHEVAGDLAWVSPEIRGWRAGDRVVATHHVSCGTCRHCRRGNDAACALLKTTHFDPGGFCEFARLSPVHVARGLLRLPEDMTYEEGSFVEPLGCVLRGQRNAGGVRPSDSVLVLGAGLSGLLHVQVAAACGASVLAADLVPFRLKAAERMGARAVFDARSFDAAALRAQNEGRRADLVVVTAGAPSALARAFECVEPGGAVLFFAPTMPGTRVEMPFNDLWRDEVRLCSTYGASPTDLQDALGLLARREVDVREMVTHRLPLARAAEGFALTAGAGESLKVVLAP